MTRFYLVWRDAYRYSDQGIPRYKHDSEQSAHAEASRLALLNPGVPFFVCTVAEMVKCEVSAPTATILSIPNAMMSLADSQQAAKEEDDDITF